MNNNIEREAFEKAMQGRAELYWLDHAGQYGSLITQHMWATWQAARAQPEQPSAGVVPEGDRDKVLWAVYDEVCMNFDFNKDPVLDVIGYLVDRGFINAAPAAPAVECGAEPVAFGIFYEGVFQEHAWNRDAAEAIASEDYAGLDGVTVDPLYTHPHNGEQGGEWVRCDERLPDKTGHYCVALSDPGDVGWSTAVSWTAFWNGDGFEDCDPIEDGQPVTHWMPMPQPPKSKEGQ